MTSISSSVVPFAARRALIMELIYFHPLRRLRQRKNRQPLAVGRVCTPPHLPRAVGELGLLATRSAIGQQLTQSSIIVKAEVCLIRFLPPPEMVATQCAS